MNMFFGSKNSKTIKPSDIAFQVQKLEFYIKDFWRFLPLPILYLNPLHIILDLDEAMVKFSGYSQNELVGETVDKLVQDSEEKMSVFKREILTKNEVLMRETTFVTKKGERIPIRVFAMARRDEKNNVIGYFLAIFDISEFTEFQKELENKVSKRTKELEESRVALMNILEDVEASRKEIEEERNKTLAIVSNLTDGLMFFDKDEVISFINPQIEKIFKVKANDLRGKSFIEIKTKEPKLKKLFDFLGTKKIRKIFREEFSLEKEKMVLEITTVFVSREGEKIGRLVILHDISREKLVERMKTEFVSVAAHQLRTPLSAIKWTLRMFIDGDLGKITKEQKEFLMKTYASNERMISLINDLLNVSRIEEGRYLYEQKLADIREITDNILKPYEEVARRKKVKLTILEPKGDFPKVKVDVEKIGLVIQNLVDNAIKYTPEGGKVIVNIKQKDEKEIEVTVEDTGMGIPKDQQSRIFTKFFRSANAMKTDTTGSGLGLFIVKNIVEAHGGKIWFESEENKGTTFYFYLPIAKK